MEIVSKLGQVNKTRLFNGREVERADWYFVAHGETFKAYQAVPDQDHFLYQNVMPIPPEVLYGKFNGIVPAHLRGPNVMCTCGSDAVIITEGYFQGFLMCRFYAMFTIHQTSATIKDGEIILPQKIESQYTHGNVPEIIEKDIKVARKYA